MRHAIAPFSLAALLCLSPLAAHAGAYEDGIRYKAAQQLPEAALAFAAALAANPRDVLAQEQLAIVQGWLNRYDDSIASWQRAQALAPGKPDYHVGLARIYYWKGEPRAALDELDTALRLAPGDTDALKLQGDVQLAAGNAAAARTSYLRVQELAGPSEELSQKLQHSVPPKSWRVDSGFIYDDYDSARGQEDSVYLQVGKALASGGSAYARYDRARNFGSVDQQLSVGSYLQFGAVALNTEFGGTIDSADFKPETQFLLNGEWLLKGPVQPLLGLKVLNYRNGDVYTLTPGLRVPIQRLSVELRYGFTENIDHSNTGVFSGRVGLEAGRFAPYALLVSGEESLPPQSLAKIFVLGAGTTFDISPSWGARVDYSYEDRRNIYKHHALGVGLTYKF